MVWEHSTKFPFCVQQKKVIWNDTRVRKWWQNLLAVTFQQSSSKSMLYCSYMWQKCIIKFVAFVVNSVISIVSVLWYLFIYLLQLKALWPITPNVIWHFTIVSHTTPPPTEHDFAGAPEQIQCTGPWIPSHGPVAMYLYCICYDNLALLNQRLYVLLLV